MTDSNPNEVERPLTPSSSPGDAHPPAGGNGAPTGPIADLESHLSPQWWQTLFDELYLQTDGDVVEDPEITEREVDTFLEVLGLEREARILDLCCGQGRHGIELARRGFGRVEGLDYSAELIELARERADEAGLEVGFRTGDARSLPYEAGTFDPVLLVGNSFGYIADEEDDRRVLKPTGHLLLDVSDGQYQRTHFEKRSWEWIGERRLVCRERTLSEDEDQLIAREVIADLDTGLVDDRCYAERLFTSEDLTALLEAAGFGTVSFTGRLGGNSTRHQDLGMMTRRHLVRAGIERVQDLYPGPARVLVEEYLPGEELTVGIIGNPPSDHRVLPIVQEDYSGLPADLPRICGYEAKWMPDSPYGSLRSVPADLPPEIERELRTQSLDLFDRLECRDYARIDWRLDGDGQPRLLEVNPNPGWCWDGRLAKQSELIGWSYAEMLARILQVVDRRLGLETPATAEGSGPPGEDPFQRLTGRTGNLIYLRTEIRRGPPTGMGPAERGS